MSKILCIGEAVKDITLRLEKAKIIKEGEIDYLAFEYGAKLDTDELYQTVGGSAANVSVGLSRLGTHSSLLALLGTDLSATEIIENLRSEGVDSSFIKRDKKFETKVAVILSAGEGDRTILIYHGKFHLTKADLDEKALMKFDFIFLGPLPDGTQDLINGLSRIVKENGQKLAVNPGSIQLTWGLDGIREVLKTTTLLILNKEEAEKILEKKPAESPEGHSGGSATISPPKAGLQAGTLGGEKYNEKELIQELLSLGVKNAIITLGKNGSLSFDGNKMVKAGIYPGERVDATGAGDSYFSGALLALSAGKSLQEAQIFGTINSASVVSHFGTQKGLLRRGDLEERAKRHNIEVREI